MTKEDRFDAITHVSHDPLTREQFAVTFGLEARTIEQWEQGRRHPDRGTQTYLRLINQYSETLAKLVADLEPINDNPAPARKLERVC